MKDVQFLNERSTGPNFVKYRVGFETNMGPFFTHYYREMNPTSVPCGIFSRLSAAQLLILCGIL